MLQKYHPRSFEINGKCVKKCEHVMLSPLSVLISFSRTLIATYSLLCYNCISSSIWVKMIKDQVDGFDDYYKMVKFKHSV